MIITTTTLVLICFNILLLFSLLFAIFTISSTDIFISIFSLVGTYFCSVWLLGLLRLEFLVFIILLVYLGAIVVLFLFIIMTIKIEYHENNSIFVGNLLFPLCCFVPVIVYVISEFKYSVYNLNMQYVGVFGNIEQIGFLLYTSHWPILILCGFILFISVVCIIRIVK